MAKKKEVEVQVVINKIQDGTETYHRGQVLMVDEEWAKARGTSIKIIGATTQATLPITPPVIVEEPAPEVVIEGTPINITEETDNGMQREGREEAKKINIPAKKMNKR